MNRNHETTVCIVTSVSPNQHEKKRKNMKKLYALCLIALAAVLIDIAFFHSTTVSAQSGQVRIQQVTHDAGLNGAVTSITGNVVGFSCVERTTSSAYPVCYIATTR